MKRKKREFIKRSGVPLEKRLKHWKWSDLEFWKPKYNVQRTFKFDNRASVRFSAVVFSIQTKTDDQKTTRYVDIYNVFVNTLRLIYHFNTIWWNRCFNSTYLQYHDIKRIMVFGIGNISQAVLDVRDVWRRGPYFVKSVEDCRSRRLRWRWRTWFLKGRPFDLPCP